MGATPPIGGRMGNQNTRELSDTPPQSEAVTDYDRAQLKLYARLLDAEADGAALSEIVQKLFGIDPGREPDRARRVHESHLSRAHWMTENGYRALLSQA